MHRVAAWFNARRRIAFRSAGLAMATIAITAASPATTATELAATVGGANENPCTVCTIGTASLMLAPAAATTPVRLPPPRADRATRPATATAVTRTVTKTTAGTTSKPATKTKTATKKTVKPAKATARTSTVATGSGRAETAVQFALAQVGKPYVWGAAGPGSYDCSGLVMAAFARAGVKLPHQSEQIGARGRAVTRAQLQRGDVILYSGHVAIALGGGMMVHAANPRTGIVVAKIYGTPYGYRRML